MDEWSFVVGNLGEKQGVKIGMPMRVIRNDRKIATLRVVDVRQKICGAVIQEMDSEKEKIRVGDRLQVDAQPNVSLKSMEVRSIYNYARISPVKGREVTREIQG